MVGQPRRTEIKTTANSRFAKAGVSCFYDSQVLNSSFVHLMKFSAVNPHLRVAAKRCAESPKRFPHNAPGDLPQASPSGLVDSLVLRIENQRS
ncbi:hypothetical protein CHU92_15470 [Flavobacterium cyanobacteriorum]|uniref:Uncharacterized protein n=1 Tax=Flavobacterium cyanobacteriorum TaxID=2022802 RepID=A0A255YRT4_9FLAO|nr:hypothetical protein CHU92_15470 [Flavobacterium cyanobacteriorum]